MTWDMYWHGDPEAVRFFREADRLSVRRADYMAWLQGRYVYDAICEVAPVLRAFSKAKRPTKYNKRPYTELAREDEEARRSEQQLENGHRAAMDIARWVEGRKRAREEEGRDG